MARNVKVIFPLDPDGTGIDVESPWAAPLGHDLYRLENIPFFYDGISLGDIFEARPAPGDPRPRLTRITKKSGNRTVRILVDVPRNDSVETMAVIKSLQELGCGIEGDGHKFFVLNVPPGVELDLVCQFLEVRGVDWEVSDPPHFHS